MDNNLSKVRHVALDMDGTIYKGNKLFRCTNPFLAILRKLGIGYTFITNNSSKSAQDYLRNLRKLGIKAGPDQLYTSTQATIEYLHRHHPHIRRLFVLGTKSMRGEVAAAGFSLARDNAADEPDAVLVGFDTQLIYSRLCRAAYWVKRGKPFIATHPDRVCPTDRPTLLVDCGSICAAIEKATGRAPTVTLGKPAPCMIRGILHRHGLRPENLAMVGDRLYTDMEMAHRAGALGVLVLTGETSAAEAARHRPKPDLIVSCLCEFGRKLSLAHRVKSSSPG